MQMVFASFESVAGLNSATPYITLALKSVSKHFKSLNNVISNQLKLISEVLRNDPSILTTTNSAKLVDTNMASLRCMDQSIKMNKLDKVPKGFLDPQQQNLWKPQRGFPEHAVAILRAWLFEHFLHPYVCLSVSFSSYMNFLIFYFFKEVIKIELWFFWC
jgi:hypothetical protein